MRVISRRARPPVSSSGASSPYSSTSVAASAVEIICGKWLIQAQSWSCASASMLATPAPIFSTHSRNSPLAPVKYFLSRSGRHKPYRTLKQIRVGAFDARLFLSGHGMSGEIAAANVLAERGRRAGKNFGLGAADIGQQSFRRKRGPQAPDQFNDRADRRRQQNHLAAAYRGHRIGVPLVNRAFVPRLFQHGSAVAADDPAGESGASSGPARRSRRSGPCR